MNTFNADGFYRTAIEHSLRSKQFVSGSTLLTNYRFNDDLFTNNGIVQKIITAPAEDALRNGFELRDVEEQLNARLKSILEDLQINTVFANALSWDRLFGGGAVLMLIDDGRKLSEPVNENRIRNIEHLEVYTPEEITSTQFYGNAKRKSYGKPEIYSVVGYHGNSFEVHESRMLLFRGSMISNYRRRSRDGWGGTVIEQVSKDLAHYQESLRLSISALEKLSQDILKLDNMATVMQSDDGEKVVQKRLQLIDLYRHLENVIAVDVKDEYDRKNLSLGGVKDIIEQAEYALSAATGIPSTILFGRSPAGMSATGESDFENYYNMVQRIQERTLLPNLVRLIYLISLASEYNLKLPEEYSIVFNPLWNASEREKAETDKIVTEMQNQKAAMFKTYLEIGAMDATEIRNAIAEDFQLDMSLDKILSEPVEDT